MSAAKIAQRDREALDELQDAAFDPAAPRCARSLPQDGIVCVHGDEDAPAIDEAEARARVARSEQRLTELEGARLKAEDVLRRCEARR